MRDDEHRLEVVVEHLRRAYLYARESNCRVWDFAVEIDSLTTSGVTTSDLRHLVNQRRILHAYEVTGSRDRSRRFRPTNNLSFSKRSCFVLAEEESNLALPPLPPPHWVDDDKAAPYWDSDRRILWVHGLVVKQFRQSSPNQESVLKAFQEEGWPPAIDDPLPHRPGSDPKCRLRNTIQSLNSHQTNRALRFRGDGSGERVLWELTGIAHHGLHG
jgi:hypothetical protein